MFLDIDGVVTSGNSHYRFDPECFDRLGKIISASGARIVITSSWKGSSVQETINFLTGRENPMIGDNPFPFCDFIVGITNDWPSSEVSCRRGLEVHQYLGSHPCSAYVILDDFNQFLPEQQKYFVQISDGVGLSDEDVDRAIGILNNDI